MSSSNRRPSDGNTGRDRRGSLPLHISINENNNNNNNNGNTQHNTTGADALPAVDNIEPIPATRRFFPRRPVGSRPPRPAEITQSIPSVISSMGSTRASRASSVSAPSRPPTIRLRRLPSNPDLNNVYDRDQVALGPHQATMAPRSANNLTVPLSTHTRPRSISDPARHSWLNDPSTIRSSQIMSPVQENPPDIPPTPPPKIPLAGDGPPLPPKEPLEDMPVPPLAQRPQSNRFGSSFSVAGARSLLGMKQRMEDVDRMVTQPPPPQKPLPPPRREYNQDIVDLLDVIDPEVSTLSTLTNVQNSLFIPNLGGLLNRNPTYDLSAIAGMESRRGSRRSSRAEPPRTPVVGDISPEDEILPDDTTSAITPALQRQHSRALSITSNLTDSHYAVLPHGVSITDWSEEEKEMLDDHVRHLMHSRREKFKRGWRGFRQYIKRPVGLFVTIYATLITLFGLAWVLFLIGWIYVGEKQLYVINIIDNVLVALFAIVGDGLAPFRAVDTYHMIFIARYHFLTWKLRRKRALPELQNHNDLPTRQFVSIEADRASVIRDLEAAWEDRDEAPVLTEKQQERFEHHSLKFSKSHTYYKPHETRTHYAFPIKLMITATTLLDFHSLFQIALGAVTWGISYHHRPEAIGHVKKKREKEKEKDNLDDLEGRASTSADALGISKESSSMSLLADEKEKEKPKKKEKERSKSKSRSKSK
ncbi:hypothetical protein ABW20_dc0109476 [Dactylellina cionopaga]|nr:hypothetical protein ABW20_dc0109476 [Dactylellina cionopaga]